MPRNFSLRVAIVSALLVLCLTAATAADFTDLKIGPLISTYSGVSHAGLFKHINEYMALQGSVDRFRDFDISTPFGLTWEIPWRGPIELTGYCSYSQYFSKASFSPFEWSSDRSLTVDLYEVVLGFNYYVDLVKTGVVEPYLGAGLAFGYAQSDLRIDLVKTQAVIDAWGEDPENGDPPPDQHFLIESDDLSIGASAWVGLRYSFSPRFMMSAEMSGMMCQEQQTFDFPGSLPYIYPGGVPENYEAANDLLMGAYTLDLNGLKLSLSLKMLVF